MFFLLLLLYNSILVELENNEIVERNLCHIANGYSIFLPNSSKNSNLQIKFAFPNLVDIFIVAEKRRKAIT